MKFRGKIHIAGNDKLINELMLTDLIDKEELQKIQDVFVKANKITSTIVDINGNPITEPSNHSKVCTLIRETKKGFQNCIMSGKNLGANSIKLKRPNFHKCQSIGFIDACAPIIIEGVHMANWLIGQNCIGDVDENRVISYAEEIGADKQALLEAFQKMDKISETDFRDNLEILINKKTAEIKQLSNFLPICSSCKKIRDDKGYWNRIEAYIEAHTNSVFSHSMCPECEEKLYGNEDWYIEMRKKKKF